MSVKPVILLLALTSTCYAFPSQPVPGEPRTRSHKDISMEGVIRAVSKILTSHQLVNSSHTDPIVIIKDYFGSDTGGYHSFLDAISEITRHSNDIQVDNADIAFYHVNAEQIQQAHVYLRRLSKLITGMVKNSAEPPIDFLRQVIGEYFYTLQAFYSNTNWIEIHNLNVYNEFGATTKDLVAPIAAPDEDTCYNCDDNPEKLVEGSCDDNLIAKKTLTSGYKSGQGTKKPAKPSDYQGGKCSHGGQDDTSSMSPATGGINKERFSAKYSPHFKLHPIASEAAVMATEYFILRNDTGLLRILGLELFRKVFSLESRVKMSKTSLAFCIDTTGSMKDDIDAVTGVAIDIVTELQGSQNAPEDYVLTTFNDPAQVTQFKTTNGYKMITELKLLAVHGGGDCPEYSMAGTLKAIELSRPGSAIYIFTDADAKDFTLQSQVERNAKSKQISLTFFITGHCKTTRKAESQKSEGQQHTKRQRRAIPRGVALYDQLSNSTGGKTLTTSKVNLTSVMDSVMVDKMPTAEISIDYVQMSTEQKNLSIVVDETVTILKMEINGCRSSAEVQLRTPNGTVANFNGTTRWLQRSKVGIVSIQWPIFGEWLLIRQTFTGNWSVNITAQSPLTFTSEIMYSAANQMMYRLNGNPIAGKPYQLFTTVYNLGNGTVSDITLKDKSGVSIATLDVQALPKSETIPGAQYISDVVFNSTVFGITVEGVNSDDNRFKRTKSFSAKPVTVILNVPPINDAKTIGESFNVTYSVTNMGDGDQTFVVQSSSHSGKILGDHIQSIMVGPNTTAVGQFLVNSLDAAMPMDITIALLTVNSSDVLQTRTRQITITRYEHPTCISTYTSDLCPRKSMNTESCSSYSWSAEALVTFSGVNITDVKLTGMARLDIHNNITTTPFNVTVSGDCCVPSVDLVIYDNEEYTGICSFDMSNGQSVQSLPSVKPEPKKKSKTQKSVVPAIVGGVCGGLVLVIILTVVFVKCRKNSRD